MMKRAEDFNLIFLNKIDSLFLMFYIIEIKHKEKVGHEIFI